MTLPSMTPLNDTPAAPVSERDVDELIASRYPMAAECATDVGIAEPPPLTRSPAPRIPRVYQADPSGIQRGIVWWAMVPAAMMAGGVALARMAGWL